MKEKTFILFKPDALEKSYIQDYVTEELMKLNLCVEKQIDYEVDEECICVLWEFTCRDDISKYAMKCFYKDYRLLLLLIHGENAIQKVHQLKKRTRNCYAINFYCNCFHAPRNKEEFVHDISYLLQKKVLESPKKTLIYDTLCFDKYTELSANQKMRSAKEVFDRVRNDGISKIIRKQKKQKKLHSIYIYNDDIHELVYVAAALYEFVPGLSISDAYLLAMGIDMMGVVLLYSSDNNNKTKEIGKELVDIGLKIKLV